MRMITATTTQSGNGGGRGLPFQNHDVREWSRVDRLTGALERARLETDHWTANTDNSSHKYGKVVDSRSLCAADGALQQQAKRQLEVYQSQIPGGRLQVIKTHTISSSRWTNNTTPILSDVDQIDRDFENLQLSVNSLDLTSQKSKANVVKNVTRRPPSRTRSKNDGTLTTSIPRVARLCRQLHEESLKQITSNYVNANNEKVSDDYKYPKLTRTKSSSSEDLNTTVNEHEEQENNHLKRTSKIRLSLQLSKEDKSAKTIESENTNNVQRISKDFETNRRLNTALRGNTVDFVSLNKLWESTASPEKESKDDRPEKKKRNSFVTAESLKEVREKLRRTSQSPSEKVEDIDDGIASENISLTKLEDTKTNYNKRNIQSYIYGMENLHNNKPNLGTGSLDSKSKFSFINRNEDWYNRRKSYGFEKVTSEHEQSNTALLKNNCDSSTDSGICKSTDVIVPESDNIPKTGSVKKFSCYFEQNGKSESDVSKDRSDIKTTIKIPLNAENRWHNFIGDRNKRHSIAVDEYVLKNGDLFPKKHSSDKISNIIIVNNENDDFLQGKRSNKKVEFCKTEIHFAADSGKVNIVETDEKPPPTNNFRRRRKHLEFNSDDFKCDMPVLHFGDSSYEKSLLGLSDIDCVSNDKNFGHENQPASLNSVTVNTATNNNVEFDDDDRKCNGENETRRGILKNKPIKPTPYILGDNENRFLETLSKESNNVWDVKLRSVDKNRNSWTSTVSISDIDKKDHSLSEEKSRETEFQKLLKTLKPVSKNTSVLNDQLNSVYMVNKVSHPEAQNVQQNGTKLSVADRIKKVEEMQSNSNKFSTKINFGNGEATVVENNNTDDTYESAKHMTWPRTENPTKDEERSGNKTDDQVSDKMTTKIKIDMTSSNKTYRKSPLSNSKLPRSPVHTFKSPKLILNTIKADSNAVTQNKLDVDSIGGIPKQLEALKMLYEDSQSEGENDIDWRHNQTQRKLEEAINDSGSVASGSWSRMKTFKNITQQLNKTYKVQNRTGRNVNYNSALTEEGSLQEQNSLYSHIKHLDGNTTFTKETKQVDNKYYENVLSAPLLTKLKIDFTGDRFSSLESIEQQPKTSDTISKSKASKVSRSLQSEFDSRKSEIYSKLPKKGAVLRQPAKSEMAYFGIRVSPESTKIKKEKVERKIVANTSVIEEHKKESPEYPIYENVKASKKFDDSVLVELNKAADEILMSVKEATPEKTVETKPLDTIPEKKSWKQEKNEKVTLKHRCSSSSVNSTQRKSTSSKQSLEKTKKKIDESSSKAIKVRRIQRANSREALLQSHGSSSEDLGVNKEPPVRKPRQIKRTKTATASNETENKSSETKKTETAKVKTNERIVTTKLPEIKHKTAVSTMRSVSGRSTNEKVLKEKSDRSKRRMPQKKVAGIKTENDREVDVKSNGSRLNTSVKAKKYQHSRE